MLKRPCSKASQGIIGEMRHFQRKTYFLKKSCDFLQILEVFYTFAKNILTSATTWRTLNILLQKKSKIYDKQR